MNKNRPRTTILVCFCLLCATLYTCLHCAESEFPAEQTIPNGVVLSWPLVPWPSLINRKRFCAGYENGKISGIYYSCPNEEPCPQGQLCPGGQSSSSSPLWNLKRCTKVEQYISRPADCPATTVQFTVLPVSVSPSKSLRWIFPSLSNAKYQGESICGACNSVDRVRGKEQFQNHFEIFWRPELNIASCFTDMGIPSRCWTRCPEAVYLGLNLAVFARCRMRKDAILTLAYMTP